MRQLKLNSTETCVLDAVKRDGKFIHDAGYARRLRYGRTYPYGARVANAITSLEEKGIVFVKRESHKSTNAELNVTYVVRLQKP